ncbi:transaldolase [Candidatus Bathyarchaeota archaeon]|nr:MAG: transaldolase [Candidatus Bathyarchaeota archaeon]
MKIFIDTAELEEIKQAVSWGIVDGVTTNPSLIKKAVDRRKGKISMEDYIKEIVKVSPGPVSLEVIGRRADEMIKQGMLLHEKFSPFGEVAIKIPINPSVNGDENLDFDGLKAIRHLSSEGISVNTTLVMTPEQALLAAKAGATYVSPFAGRIDDYIRANMGMKIGKDFQKGDYLDHELLRSARNKVLSDAMASATSIREIYKSSLVHSAADRSHDNGIYSGVDLVTRILRIFRAYNFKTEVIAASIRNSRQVREMAELGVHIATVPFNVLKDMIKHYKTSEGMRRFMDDVVPQYRELFMEK